MTKRVRHKGYVFTNRRGKRVHVKAHYEKHGPTMATIRKSLSGALPDRRRKKRRR